MSTLNPDLTKMSVDDLDTERRRVVNSLFITENHCGNTFYLMIDLIDRIKEEKSKR